MKYVFIYLLIVLFAACTNESTKVSKIKVSSTSCLDNSVAIGVYENQELVEGGFSGLFYIPGSDLEFYTVTDRGPNTFINETKQGEVFMLFPIQDYAQKIIRLKFERNTFKIVSVHEILDGTGVPVTGIAPEGLIGDVVEHAVFGNDEQKPNRKRWSFDFEGISMDKNGDFWLADEYRPALVHVDGKTFKIKNVFAPDSVAIGGEQVLDINFAKRRPNRGFEGVTVSPSGKIWAMLQSPIPSGNANDSMPNRLVRILEFDPITKISKVYGYEMSEDLKDPKIGDITAINDHELLIIEHGKNNDGKVARVYHVDMQHASDLLTKFIGEDKSFEDLLNNAKAQYYGLILAQKSLALDLIKAGFNSDFGKPEGLTIIDGSTIAVVNDNDFSIEGLEDNGRLIMNEQPSCLYIFKLPKPLF